MFHKDWGLLAQRMYEHKTWGWLEWLAINHQKIFMFIYLELLKHGNTKLKWTPVFGPAIKVDRGSLELRHGEWVSWQFLESFYATSSSKI